MENDKKNLLLIISSIILLVGIFFVLIMSFLLNGSQQVIGDNQAENLGELQINQPDVLITSAAKLYSSMVRATDPVRGRGNLLIMEFGDYECPYCAQLEPALTKILEEYGDQVRLIWKDFVNPVHLKARGAALAARCAADQGAYWQYHDYLFANQDNLSRQLYGQIAVELNFDLADFNKCLDSSEKIELLGQGMEDGQALGVDATPYLFIGNERFDYALSYQELKSVVENQLSISP